MGGFGSGRPPSVSRTPVLEDFQSIDVRYWSRHGYIEDREDIVLFSHTNSKQHTPLHLYPNAGEITIRKYMQTSLSGESGPIVDVVKTTHSNCNYGGKRIWFVCPIETCNKRVAILYFDERFQCRHCMKKLYRSQQESKIMRIRTLIKKTRIQLKWNIDHIYEYGSRPNGMSTITYWRLWNQHHSYVTKYLELFRNKLVS